MISQSIHNVESIELSMIDPTNSNLRELRVIYDGGQIMTIAFFGNSDALKDIPKSEVFFEKLLDEYKAEKPAIEEEEIPF